MLAESGRKICTRGSLVGDRVRYRGRLLLSELPAGAIATVLAHDAGLERPAEATPLPPITPEVLRSHFDALADGFSDLRSHAFEAEGSVRIDYKGIYGEAKISVRIDGGPERGAPPLGKGQTAWVETRFSRGAATRETVLAKLNQYNRGFPLVTSDDDVNFDMEPFARSFLDGDEIVVAHRVLANSFAEGIDERRGLDPFVAEIADAKKNLMRELGIEEELPLGDYADAIGIPFGPCAQAMARRYARAKVTYKPAFGEVSKRVRWLAEYGSVKKEAFATTWGRARPFLEASYKDGLTYESCVVALVEGGTTTDDCTCIAYIPWGERAGQAAVVAPNLRGLLSLLAIGTPGLDVVDEETARHARRRFFAMYYDQADMVAWLEGLGIRPAEDPLAVVQVSGLPRFGTIALGANLAGGEP